jgi:hypothetical protein
MGDLRLRWEAYPAAVQPVQTSSNSCGMWALAQIVALLRGYQMTGLEERDMKIFKHWLYMRTLNLQAN